MSGRQLASGIGIVPTWLRIGNHRIQMRAGEGCFTIAEGNIVPNHSVIVDLEQPITQAA